jgi:hypothetical protein
LSSGKTRSFAPWPILPFSYTASLRYKTATLFEPSRTGIPAVKPAHLRGSAVLSPSHRRGRAFFF